MAAENAACMFNSYKSNHVLIVPRDFTFKGALSESAYSVNNPSFQFIYGVLIFLFRNTRFFHFTFYFDKIAEKKASISDICAIFSPDSLLFKKM